LRGSIDEAGESPNPLAFLGERSADIAGGVAALIQAGLDKIDQGITIFDADLKLVFCNERVLTLLDMPAAVMTTGADFGMVIRYNAERGEYGLGDIGTMVADRVAIARQFKAHTLERTRPNGTVLRISGWPLPGGGFATVYTDITEQRRRELSLESRLLRQTEDLRRNEERLRLIANEVPAGIAYLDRDQTFRFVNLRFASAYRSAPPDLIGLPPHKVLLPKTMAAVQPFFDRAIAGEPLDFDLEIEFPDGRVLDTRTFLRPERDGSGRSGFYVLTINVTRQKQATAALMRAQKIEALGQLSSGIAHDFNNLLTVILGNLKPLEPHVEETLRDDMLAPAIRAAKRGADLTRRLLAVARRQPLEPAPVDVAETARNIAKLVKPSLPEDAEITVSAPDQPCFAFADPSQLETCLLNLAVNARDALGTAGTIGIAMERRTLSSAEAAELGVHAGDHIDIRVTDNGSGICPEITEKIFDPFFSTKNNHDRSGLGLTIVQSFVQDSGGAIHLAGRSAGGSEFRLLLPACEPAAVSPMEPMGRLPVELASGLVLLVDDDDEVRSVLRRDLLAMGCRLIEARTAPEAFDLIGMIENVALVLSDIAMPGAYSGLELAAKVTRAHPRIKVVLMTGYGGEGLRDGAPDIRILQKPFGRRTLMRAFREAFPPADAS
jgi:PAS domain S-box-containing protein